MEKRWPILLVYSVVPIVPSLLCAYLIGPESMSTQAIAIEVIAVRTANSLVTSSLFLICYGGFMAACDLKESGSELFDIMEESAIAGLKTFPRVLVGALFGVFFSALGLLALVLPGVYLFVAAQFGLVAVARGEVPPRQIISRGHQIVKKAWLQVLPYCAFSAIGMVLGFLIPILGATAGLWVALGVMTGLQTILSLAAQLYVWSLVRETQVPGTSTPLSQAA